MLGAGINMEHPLKVYVPVKGIFYLLQWWTHNKQDSLAIQSSEEGLMRTGKRLMNGYSDFRVKGIYEVELVAPSNLMCLKAIADQQAEKVKDFMNEVGCAMNTAFKAGKPLPPQFVRCDNWKPGYLQEGQFVDSDEDPPNSYALEWHPDCRNCMHGFKLVGFTPETFYDAYYAPWCVTHPRRGPFKSKCFYSQAEPAADDEVIWEAMFGGGFSSGAELNLLEPGTYKRPEAFFYYRLRRELDKTSWEEEHIKLKAQKKEFEEEHAKQRVLKRERENNEAIDKALMVLQERT